jgi:hypothetical protein
MKKAPPWGGAENCPDERWQTFECDNSLPKSSPKKLPRQVLASARRSKPAPITLPSLKMLCGSGQGDLFGQPPPDRYPAYPGSKSDLPTSREAARKTASAASALQNAVLAEIEAVDSTADEIASRLDRSILVIRPRVSELHAAGLIEPTAKRRRNASGLLAMVWTSQIKSKDYVDEQGQSVIV